MVRDLFKEKLEYQITRFNTKLGLWDFFIGSAVWAFIIVNYKDLIYNYILPYPCL